MFLVLCRGCLLCGKERDLEEIHSACPECPCGGYHALGRREGGREGGRGGGAGCGEERHTEEIHTAGAECPCGGHHALGRGEGEREGGEGALVAGRRRTLKKYTQLVQSAPVGAITH